MFYTYLIGWSDLNKYYYGVRYSKHAEPSDLWIKYKTSSKYVKEFYTNHGEPDIIQVRKTFDNTESAILWESKVLRRLGVVKDERFLNRWENNMVPHNYEGQFQKPEIQDKVNTTLIEKYGGRGSASKEIKERVHKTVKERYGVDTTIVLDHVKQARIEKSLELTGYDNVFKSNEYIQSKFKEKYGVTNPMHVQEFRDKLKDSLSHVDYEARKLKTQETNLEKYGTKCSMNRPEVRERNKRPCPYGCKDNHKYDAGNFTNHMKKVHKWSKEQINEYKKNKNVRFENWNEDKNQM